MARLGFLKPTLATLDTRSVRAVHTDDPAQVERARKSEVDRWRGTPKERGYDAAWRKVRASVLAAEPLCRFCDEAGRVTPATVVDHIVPIADAPDRRLDPTNLRPLCKPCHDRRTAREQGFTVRR